MQFCVNESSFDLMLQMQLSEKMLHRLKSEDQKNVMNRDEIEVLLEKLPPNKRKQKANRQIILESAIVACNALSV